MNLIVHTDEKKLKITENLKENWVFEYSILSKTEQLQLKLNILMPPNFLKYWNIQFFSFSAI